jgi:hypothetical protein
MLKLIGANEDNRRLGDIDPFRVYADSRATSIIPLTPS